ncbi:hypothetical protein PHMEG_00021238, partial [Phytophthora megakarya]
GVVQASVIVALMSNTFLHVYPGGISGQAAKTKRKTLILNRGDDVLFRGDLAHVDSGHAIPNYRLHCYVCVKGIKQKPNSTEAVVFMPLRCPNCRESVYSRPDFAEHKKQCTVDANYAWDECGRTFRKPNSLASHKSLTHNKRTELNEELDDAEEGMDEGSGVEEDVEEGGQVNDSRGEEKDSSREDSQSSDEASEPSEESEASEGESDEMDSE